MVIIHHIIGKYRYIYIYISNLSFIYIYKVCNYLLLSGYKTTISGDKENNNLHML